MIWKLIKTAIWVVGTKKMLGFKFVRQLIGKRIASKTRALLPG